MVRTVPGKVFILGEYAALENRPSIVATLGPRFGASFLVEGDPAPLTTIHPRSPAGRLTQWAEGHGLELQDWEFQDPRNGTGGFGASSAQFALLYRALCDRLDLNCSALGARDLYRELLKSEEVVPSGADLVAQWSGGVTVFDPSFEGIKSISNVMGDWDWSKLIVFESQGRKVMTHEHLNKDLKSRLTVELMDELEKIVRSVLAHPGDAQVLGAALTAYAERLSSSGLEVPAAREDRLAIAQLPGVLGVKGAGALLSDAFIVLVEERVDAAAVADLAMQRGLRLATCSKLGITAEAGIQ